MQIAEILIAATAYYCLSHCHWELFESLTDFRCLIVGSYEKYLAFLPVSRFALPLPPPPLALALAFALPFHFGARMKSHHPRLLCELSEQPRVE